MLDDEVIGEGRVNDAVLFELGWRSGMRGREDGKVLFVLLRGDVPGREGNEGKKRASHII